ncbi:PAS domain S-box protein [Chloroflexota bacterium]
MPPEKTVTSVTSLVRSVHFWIILALMAALTILHYVEELGIVDTSDTSLHFGLQRHAVDRILFLLPIVYALVVFGLTGGIVTSIIALSAMLPRAIVWSPDWRDAFFEIGAVMIIATVACLWFRARIRGEMQRLQAAAEMDIMQDELQSHIRLSRSNEIRLAMLNAISNMLSHSLDLKSLLTSAINTVMDVMEVEAVMIFSLDEYSQELKPVAYEGVTDKFIQESSGMKPGEGFNGLVAQTGEPLVVEDASTDPRLTREVVREEKIQAQLIVPLKAKGQITGTLCVANRRPRQFLSQEVQLLGAIGNQIAIAMDNARLYQEQQVIAAEYRAIFENASDAIWIQDLDGNIQAANDATVRLTGYSRQELLHRKASEFLSEDGVELAQKIKQRLLQREIINEPYDQRITRKDQTEAFLRLTSNLIISDGKPVGFQHIARDVTMEREMEEHLRFYIEQITKAQEEERKRIARELHDETAQQLIALSHQLEDFARNNERLSPDDIELLGSWRRHIKDTQQGLRWFIRELRPPMIDDLGLLPAVKWLIDELKVVSGMSVDLKVIGPERRFNPEAELVLFRIVQEALANVRRHAEASEVHIILEFADDQTSVTISDNGRGFQMPKALGEMSHLGKLGLIGMEERARLISGKLTVKSEVGVGTNITIVVPL